MRMKTAARTIVVRISDVQVSDDPEVILVTRALGSCVGVTAYDSVRRIGGMLHYQLPASEIDARRAEHRPAMYADTGLALLFKQLAALGADCRRLKVHLAGGAQMLAGAELFDIGRRNHTAARKFLWQRALLIEGEEIGGTAARHMFLRLADGAVHIKTCKQPIKR